LKKEFVIANTLFYYHIQHAADNSSGLSGRMGQTQSTDASGERTSVDNRTNKRTDYYKLLDIERDASDEE
jgi:hypothetical protein